MCKFPALTAACVAAGALLVSTSVAQDPAATVISGNATVTPNKAGTRKHPQAVKLSGKAH
jgi:hypothetical protein